MKNTVYDKAYLAAGSAASGAGIATALAGLTAINLPLMVPIIGALLGVGATVLSGALEAANDGDKKSD